MVRNYKRKRLQEVNEDDIKNAVFKVINGDMKLSDAAAVYNVKVNTLFYRVKKHKENNKPKDEEFTSKYTTAQVFTRAEEKMLSGYLLKSSDMHYGLTYKQTKRLAYEYATALKKCPPKWTENGEAGTEWLKGFMKRHTELSLRKPENTSLSRSTSFNKHNVGQFNEKYEKLLSKYKFTPDRIYNLDETNIMTVVQAPKVIAKTGAKQVGQAVSAERGQLITMCGIVNAIGNTLPPAFIFPRARFHSSMLSGAPVGSVGYANSPTSGWMTGPLFIKVLEHIHRLVRCTKEDPVLILMDNHESHCTLDAINYYRENGMKVLTFPPHCTHRMQPLDVAVNGPFKQKLSVAQNDWLLNNPGKTITIHDLCGIVTPAFNMTYVARNIISGFSKPGIYPFSRNAFSDEDFGCAEVTNRPYSELNSETVALNNTVACNALAPQSTLAGSDCSAVTPFPIVSQPNIDSASLLTANLEPQPALASPISSAAPVLPSSCNSADSSSLLTANLAPQPVPATPNSSAAPVLPSTCSSSTSLPILNTSNHPYATVSSPACVDFQKQIANAKHSVPLLFTLATEAVRNCAFSTLQISSSVLNAFETQTAFTNKDSPKPVESVSLTLGVTGISAAKMITPEMVKPFPIAAPRTDARKGRKKGKPRILSDTPEKQEVEAAYLERMSRLKKIQDRKKNKKQNTKKDRKQNKEKEKDKKQIKKQIRTKTTKRKAKKDLFSEDSDETDTELNLNSEEDDIHDFHSIFTDEESSENEAIEVVNHENINLGDFLLIEIIPNEKKPVKLAFVGRVDEKDGNGFIVNFLKRKSFSPPKFFFPEKQDTSFVNMNDIITKLPKPTNCPGTSRTMSLFTFKFKFENFKMG